VCTKSGSLSSDQTVLGLNMATKKASLKMVKVLVHRGHSIETVHELQVS
jgi:hypothetical protein